MRTVSLIVLVFCLFVGALKAEIITVQVTAEITQFEDNGSYFDSSISVGSTLVMTYSYDTESVDSNPDSDYGVYYQLSPDFVQVEVGNYVFESDIDNLDYFVSLTRRLTTDSYMVMSTNNLSPTDSYSGTYRMSWQINYAENIFEDMSLPTSEPGIENYISNSIWILADRDFNIFATPISVEIIPEPITLLTLGLGGLVIRIKRS